MQAGFAKTQRVGQVLAIEAIKRCYDALQWGGFETFCAQLSPTAVRLLLNAILDAAEAISDYPWKADRST